MEKVTHYLDLGLMERMCHGFAVHLFDLKDDPIAPFSQRNHALLQSALDLPRTAFGGRDMYPTLAGKATILWYTLNKNHAFQNGNKRISAASLLVFLFINDHWLDAGITELVDQSLRIAKSTAGERDEVLKSVENWVQAHLVLLDVAKRQQAA